MLEILQIVIWLVAVFAWYRLGKKIGYEQGHKDAMRRANKALDRVLLEQFGRGEK